jgi:hypothetical protein
MDASGEVQHGAAPTTCLGKVGVGANAVYAMDPY